MAISIPFARAVPVRMPLLAILAILLVLLLWTLTRGPAEPVIELTPPSAAPTPAPLPAALPIQAAPPPPAPIAAEASVLPSLILRGVTGGGAQGGAAIFDVAGGMQRVVRVGRTIAPGTTLTSVGLDHAVVNANGSDFRLTLGKSGGVALAASVPGTSPVAALAAAPSATGGSQRDTMDYRLGLQPVKSGSRTAGYAVRPGARLPHLSAAGLQPGDIILRVNGSELDEERMMELSWQIANSGGTEIEYSRGGQKNKIVVNPSS
jgi:type II secretion system protein C